MNSNDTKIDSITTTINSISTTNSFISINITSTKITSKTNNMTTSTTNTGALPGPGPTGPEGPGAQAPGPVLLASNTCALVWVQLTCTSVSATHLH